MVRYIGFSLCVGLDYRYHRKIIPADDVLGSDPASIGSDRNPLDLIECDLVAGAVVKLGRARALVRDQGLCVFERAARLEIGGDAGRPEHVAAELPLKPASAVRRRTIS